MKFSSTILNLFTACKLPELNFAPLLAALLLFSSCDVKQHFSVAAVPATAAFAAQPETDNSFLKWAGNAPVVQASIPELDLKLQVSQYIRRMFQDRSGNIWFGTQGDGAVRLNGKDLFYLKKAQGLAGDVVRGIVQDDAGNMWFSTEQGVSRYNYKQANEPCNIGNCSHELRAPEERAKHDAIIRNSFTNFSTKDGLLHNDLWSIAKDSKGNIWFGSMAGLNRFDGKKFSSFPLPAAEVETNPRFNTGLVWSIFEDKAGNTWFATDGAGIRKFDGVNMTAYSTADGLADNNVGSILQDRSGALWFGTRFGGLSRFANGVFTNFSTKDGLSNNFIGSMLQDKSGKIWLGTIGGGVCRFDPEKVSKGSIFIEHFGQADGLFNQHVQSLLEDKQGGIWIGTSGGVYQFDGKKFINYRKRGC